MIKILWSIVVVATTLLVLVLLWQFRIAIVLFLLSLAAAAALRPMITNIMEKKFTKRFALGFVYSSLIVSILAIILLVGSPLIQDIEKVSNDLITTYENIKTSWPHQTSLFKQALAEQLPPSTDILNAITSPSTEAQNTRQGVWTAAQNFFSLFGYLSIVIILSLYWSADQLRFERLALSMFPQEHHAKVLHVWRAIETGVGAYIRSETVQGVFAGFFLLLGYLFMGVRYPVLLTLWAVVARLVPWFGIPIAVFPLTLIGFGNPTLLGFLPAIYTMIVLILLTTFIQPYYVPREHTNSLSIVLFVIAMAQISGVIGVLLAPILAVAVQIFFQELYPAFVSRFSAEPLRTAADLRRRLRNVRAHTRQSLPAEDQLIFSRTGRLLERVRQYIVEQ